MRRLIALVAVLGVIGCDDTPPTSAVAGDAPALAKGQNELVPPVVFNTQLRSELEVPACESESQGHAHLKVLQDGTIESMVKINNKDSEVVFFGHIHHLDPAPAETGPVIWWLTNPVGQRLNLTDRHLDFRQSGIFVTNPHFTGPNAEEDALARLLSHPEEFYVNFHSADCPGGFARGFLP